jgi:hypothetical protein
MSEIDGDERDTLPCSILKYQRSGVETVSIAPSLLILEGIAGQPDARRWRQIGAAEPRLERMIRPNRGWGERSRKLAHRLLPAASR